MNEIYRWQTEALVAMERQEFKREMDNIRLIRDAGLSNPGLFERAAIALGKGLMTVGGRLHKNFTDPQQAYQVTSSKYAA
jgi:hypothetical protein